MMVYNQVKELMVYHFLQYHNSAGSALSESGFSSSFFSKPTPISPKIGYSILIIPREHALPVLVPQTSRSEACSAFFSRHYLPITFIRINHPAGTISDGSIFIVLQSLIFKIERPEVAIKTPPTIEISAISGSERNTESALAPR